MRGDFTPYWEDGARSSSRETAMARHASERLVQAESLWAIWRHKFPVAEFSTAWRDVLLYNEHTWGAHCSISQPDSPFTQRGSTHQDNGGRTSRTPRTNSSSCWRARWSSRSGDRSAIHSPARNCSFLRARSTRRRNVGSVTARWLYGYHRD